MAIAHTRPVRTANVYGIILGYQPPPPPPRDRVRPARPFRYGLRLLQRLARQHDDVQQLDGDPGSTVRSQRDDRTDGLWTFEFRLGLDAHPLPLPGGFRELPDRDGAGPASHHHRFDRSEPRLEHVPVERDRLRRYGALDTSRQSELPDHGADDLQRRDLRRGGQRRPRTMRRGN